MVDLCFVDLETTHLDPRVGRIWEVGVIQRRDGADREYWWQLAVDLKHANPQSLEVGQFHHRYQVPAGVEAIRIHPETGERLGKLTMGEFIFDFQQLFRVVDDRPVTHFAGAVPSFDDAYLKALLQPRGYRVCWHYHLLDVENLAAGRLGVQPPWDSEVLSRAVGVDPDRYARHTALGDCRWARDIYDAVMGVRS